MNPWRFIWIIFFPNVFNIFSLSLIIIFWIEESSLWIILWWSLNWFEVINVHSKWISRRLQWASYFNWFSNFEIHYFFIAVGSTYFDTDYHESESKTIIYIFHLVKVNWAGGKVSASFRILYVCLCGLIMKFFSWRDVSGPDAPVCLLSFSFPPFFCGAKVRGDVLNHSVE